jgi:zeta toxin family protein
MTDLSPQQLQKLFETRIIPHLQDNRNTEPLDVEPGERPHFVSVGGQPGAGKGRVIEVSGRAHPGSVIVNGDDLRPFHPDYDQVMDADPLSMPEVTAQAAGTWVGMSNQWLRDNKISAVVETTLRQPAVLLREFDAFKRAGYSTELRVVAVPPGVSRLGTVSRYIGQVQEFGAGRVVAAEGHDIPTAAVPDTVAALVASGLVDRVVVQDRDGRVFLDADVSANGSELVAQAREVVDRAREVQAMAPEQAQGWFRAAGQAVEALRDVPVDHDLLQVSARLTGDDAAAIAAHAWPRDQARQQSQVDELHQLHRNAATVAETRTATRSAKAPVDDAE